MSAAFAEEEQIVYICIRFFLASGAWPSVLKRRPINMMKIPRNSDSECMRAQQQQQIRKFKDADLENKEIK